MFSGIVKSIGIIRKVQASDRGRECIIVPNLVHSFEVAQSVLVSGICSTITRVQNDELSFFYMAETLEKTNVLSWTAGLAVNIEPSLKLTDALSGHFVFGHIDGKGKIERIKKGKDSWIFFLKAPRDIVDFFVAKGSVALDGVSLTLIDVMAEDFSCALTPFTLKHTTFGLQEEGKEVNIEIDILAKYVKNLFQKPRFRASPKSGKETNSPPKADCP